MTLTAQFGIPIDPQFYAVGIRIVLTSGSVAALASNPRFRPDADNAGEAVLMAFRVVACGMTQAAIIRLFFTRMVFGPAAFRPDNRIGKVILS